jgi:3-hydroxymyristoyl/3-hydroxydecanoyl-(acyl carrier protein) dehydratase
MAPMATESAFVIPADHAALPGHFPGSPLVPGVLLLAHVAAALEREHGPVRVTAIRQAKFLAPLRPGERCTIDFADAGPGETRFECRSGSAVLVRGSPAFATDVLRPRSRG